MYSIAMTLCNFLLACGTALKSVTVLTSEAVVPTVSILDQSQRTLRRNTVLTVRAHAFT